MLKKLLDLYRFLYVQRIVGFPPPGDEPFMDPVGVVRFRQELTKAKSYLEFGSGGTTILADRAGIPTISVENDRFFARSVAQRLSGGNVRQIIVQTGITREWGFPLAPNERKALAYVTAPFGNSSFPDLILVDGRWRVACALHSAACAYRTGNSATLMFDDYAERAHYHAVERYLGMPEMVGRAAIFRLGREVPRAAMCEALRDPR